MRVNQARDFAIAGYTPGPRGFDAAILGHNDGGKLIYVARTRNGFTPASREALFRQFTGLEVVGCPFANRPEANGGRWGEGLTVEKMRECRWLVPVLVPVLVGRVGFLEWTVHGHLRHSRFIRLREDRQARDVQREGQAGRRHRDLERWAIGSEAAALYRQAYSLSNGRGIPYAAWRYRGISG
jgi:bifunctional non-homologous end joining protein LigD